MEFLKALELSRIASCGGLRPFAGCGKASADALILRAGLGREFAAVAQGFDVGTDAPNPGQDVLG